MGKFYIKTFGCQMNVCDSQKMAGILHSLGYDRAGTLEQADVVIVNTCSVRAKPDNKAYSFIGSLRALKKKNPATIVAVGGCIPQKEGRKLLRFSHVDLVFGTYNFARLKELIERARRERVVEVLSSPAPEERQLPFVDSYLENPYVAYVTVQRGCNRFCSYCIVPYTRGAERSVEPEHVLEEVRRLAERGVKEVHLLGQNVDFYASRGVDFADLLYMVAEVDGIERIRFQTSHPAGFSRKVVDALKNIDKVCPYVHLPPQSGSDRVLRRMNRGYTRQEYIEKVEMLRSEVPEVVLSGDFIVGFPGETEEDFEETLSLVKVCAFHKGFVFKFSPRPLTEASKLPDDVPEDVKNRRLRQLQELLKSQALADNRRLVGRTVKVLIERDNPKGSGLYGRTPGNEPVIVEGEPELKGKVVNVRITDATPFFLRGQVNPSKECGHGGSFGNRHNAG